MNRTALKLSIPLLISAIYGCGSDNANDSLLALPAPIFAGTVSISAGVAEPVVTLKNPAGDLVTASIDDVGGFSHPDALIGDRYLMRVDLGNDNFLYSIAHLSEATANRQNIHSYTDLVARAWFADLGLGIDSVFNSGAGIENFPTIEAIETIEANVQAIVSDALEVYGLSAIELSTVLYEATDTGVDRFLNENPVIIQSNLATIIVNDPQTNMQSTAVNGIQLATTFGTVDISSPDQPQNLRALGASESEIALAWSIANDNIGITTYDIYRNNTLVTHTPFPVYRDSGLLADTDYTYSIVARDEASNSSEPSDAATGRVLSTPDTASPDIPSRASLDASTQTINVYWSHSRLNDIISFEVTRTGGDGIIIREVTSTRFKDITVASGTEYCYGIVAVDASGNRSESNPLTCITTSGANIVAPTENNSLATIEMAQSSITSSEGTTATAFVNRLGDSSGEISIEYIVTPGTAIADEDYSATDGTLVWADGDIVAKRIEVELLADGISDEESETLSIVLTNSSANAVVSQASTSVTISAN